MTSGSVLKGSGEVMSLNESMSWSNQKLVFEL